MSDKIIPSITVWENVEARKMEIIVSEGHCSPSRLLRLIGKAVNETCVLKTKHDKQCKKWKSAYLRKLWGSVADRKWANEILQESIRRNKTLEEENEKLKKQIKQIKDNLCAFCSGK